jgi:hypothetical protein
MGNVEVNAMKRTIAIVLLSAAALASYAEECKEGYATTIIVQFRDGRAVSGANVRVELKCGKGGEQSAITNTNGEARFPYSLDQLSAMQITLGGFSSDSVPKSNCSGPDNDKRCVVKLGS